MAAVEPPNQVRPSIEIDEALRKGWFEFWYQPKIDLKRKCLAGAEALARIRHPKLGVLLPGSVPARHRRGQHRAPHRARAARHAAELVDFR